MRPPLSSSSPPLQALVREWPNGNIPNQFFRMMDDEVPLMVGPCGHFFEQDEYEMVRTGAGGEDTYRIRRR